MPAKLVNATESAPKRSPLRLLLAVALLVFGGYLLVSAIVGLTDNKTVLMAPNGRRLQAEVVDTPELMTKGLSGREGLADNQVMLFSYDDANQHHCMWMKDMKFSIDIVWLDSSKKVITIKQNATPESYPESFCPSSQAQYVVELPAGQAAVNKFEVGAQVRF